MELSPSVDVPVTVTTVWTGPDGFMTTNTAQPVMGSTTTYISREIVNLLGDYTCTATLSSNISSFLINETRLSSDFLLLASNLNNGNKTCTTAICVL